MGEKKQMTEKDERVSGLEERTIGVFNFWKDYYTLVSESSPQKAESDALNQTLYSTGLNKAQIKLADLDMETSTKIAEALIEVAGPRMQEIVQEFTKGKFGDFIEKFNFSDPRAKRILAAARKSFRS